MPKKKKKKRILKKIARWHCLFSLALFGLYIGLSLIYSPEFLLSDIRQKFRALADETLMVTARVLDPPEKPVVTGEAVCSNGSLSINLNWADDENSETFDIDRDSLPLITGLTESQYTDNNVVVNTSYAYVVTARGPMGPGFEISDSVTVTTPAECEIDLPDATMSITSFAGKSIGSYGDDPHTENRKPFFSGTTNIANANITLFINGPTIISAQTQANINGYWTWQPPINLSYGSQNILVTAVDPLDLSRTVSANLNFRIVKDENKEDEIQKKTVLPPASVEQPKEVTPPEEPALPETSVSQIPLDFSLALEEESVLQGNEIKSTVRITRLEEKFAGSDAVIRYLVLDEKGEKKTTLLQDAVLNRGSLFNKSIPIPAYLAKGKYHLQVEIILDRYNVSQEKSFEVLEKLILNLGGGILISYPEFLSNLGLIASVLILLLLLWLMLFSREYWLYLHALRHITERHLEKIGLFGSKRGRGVSR